MATAMFSVTLLYCLIVPTVADLMRAEQRDADVELHLGAQGELQTLKDLRHPKDSQRSFGEKLDAEELLKKVQASVSTKQNDMCDLDFPLGKANQDACKDNDKRIDDRAQCHEAATQNHGDDKKDFMLDSNWFDVHPEGCFAAPCDFSKVNATVHTDVNSTTMPEGLCYYFNPTGDSPSGPITGTPVCERPKFLNTTAPNINVEGCPAGYERIYNEGLCHTVGGCLSDPDASEFRVGIKNFSQHYDFPRGCFIADDGEVYYNPIKDPHGAAIPVKADASVFGMALCAVKGKAGNAVKGKAKAKGKGKGKGKEEGAE